ncbi:hypothetical protein [Clostridium sp. D33t1_170424_F3]|uniref:hypothetical protein n=1 Tax=Clostridium sp. D33t1_170424_F3 TaxID=2787099 RepID=UPI0018ABDDBC|nr:hypothetical protein [Clostridium sp. D33t1_170424_F3]
MSRIRTFYQVLGDSYYENPFTVSIGPFLILISFSFPVGSVIWYILILLAFGLSCCQSFRIRRKYGREMQKSGYSFVSFLPLILILAYLLTGAAHYFIMIAAGLVFLYDVARIYIMDKKMTKEEGNDDPGGFKKP